MLKLIPDVSLRERVEDMSNEVSMQAIDALEARIIYPDTQDTAGQVAGAYIRASLLQAAAKSGMAVESFPGGYSPIANETPNPAIMPPIMENKAAEYLGLGQAAISG